MPESFESLHALYCRLTARTSNYALCERRWFEWSKHFTQSDLETVLEFIRYENKRHDWQYSVKFSRLIGDLENFNDLLSEAKAVLRNRRPAKTPKEQALAQLRPQAGEQPASDKVIPIRDALRRAVNEI